MPISMWSTLFHINVFHYILLSANAGVKPVFIPHMATMRRLGNALARLESSFRQIRYLVYPASVQHPFFGQWGGHLCVGRDKPRGPEAPVVPTGPTKGVLTSAPSTSHLRQLLFVASLSLIFYIIAVSVKC